MSAFSVAQYNALCASIAKGITSAEVNGEKVQYRSLAEMLNLKAMMERDLGIGGVGSIHTPTVRKG